MGCLGNVLWLLCGGLMTAVEYMISGVLMMCTIVGIPFGLQAIKLGILCLWPFGSRVERSTTMGGCLDTLMNIIWFFVGGIEICLTHLGWGLLLCITIVGIPWGMQHFKMAGLALTPFGRVVI